MVIPSGTETIIFSCGTVILYTQAIVYKKQENISIR